MRLGRELLPVFLGIVLYLTLGKPMEIVGAAWLAVESMANKKATRGSARQGQVISLLFGVSFTEVTND